MSVNLREQMIREIHARCHATSSDSGHVRIQSAKFELQGCGLSFARSCLSFWGNDSRMIQRPAHTQILAPGALRAEGLLTATRHARMGRA
jgi:hypothetical protein